MFIKFDDLDMFDFFISDPVYIGEKEAAHFIYSIEDDYMFSMSLMVDTYGQKIDVSVSYDNNIVFAGQFDNILEIRKSEDVLLVEMESEKRLIIKKSPNLGVVLESI